MSVLRVVFPDPLVWQAGLEYGLEALALLKGRGLPVHGVVRRSGPMFEAIGFAWLQLGLGDRLVFGDVDRAAMDAQVLAYPRVHPMPRGELCSVLGRGRAWVVCSDPELDFVHPRLVTIPCRSAVALADAFAQLQAE